MADRPALRPEEGSVADGMRAVARDILKEASAAVTDGARSNAEAVHDFRKAMKRWRAFLRLVEPLPEARRLRIEARDAARGLADARDRQAAIDALDDLRENAGRLSASTLNAIRARIEEVKRAAEITTLTPAMRERLLSTVKAGADAVACWPLDGLQFADVARQLTETYRRARRAVPVDWRQATARELHRLRRRVVEHRYQMELVVPLWPRLGRLWVEEAQRMRDRLGAYQDLVVLSQLAASEPAFASWGSRLAPVIAERQAALVWAAVRLAGRLFAERPKAFRRRLETLWENGRRTTK
jgi:CHAD domain-containing protein